MTVSCAWCGLILRRGEGPVSHGICEDCARRELAALDELLSEREGVAALEGPSGPTPILPRGIHESRAPADSRSESSQISHDPTKRAEAATTPEGAKGWVDQAGSAQVLAGGHGLDVAPDASPEGIRAEARHERRTAGASRATSPTPPRSESIPVGRRGAAVRHMAVSSSAPSLASLGDLERACSPSMSRKRRVTL